MERFFRVCRVAALVLPAVLLAGCRTYGGYGSEEETLEQIGLANRLFTEELQRAQTDLAAVQRAAEANPALGPFGEHFAAVLGAHALLLESHQELAERVEGSGRYRDLHRAYHTIITEQQAVRDRYASALAGLRSSADTTFQEGEPLADRYQVAPPFYERLRAANERRPLGDVLRDVPAGGPSAGPAADPAAPALQDTLMGTTGMSPSAPASSAAPADAPAGAHEAPAEH